MGRKWSSHGGNYSSTQIPAQVFDEFCKKWPEFSSYKEDYRYNNSVTLSLRYLDLDQLEFIVDAYRDIPEKASEVKYIGACLAMVLRPNSIKISSCKKAEPAIVAWLKNDLDRGWIFDTDSGLPELVIDVKYYPYEEDNPAHSVVYTRYWSNGGEQHGGIVLHNHECDGRTVSEILLKKGYIHESPELHAEYEKREAQYLEWRDKIGMQYLSDGAKVVNDMPDDHKDTDTRTAVNRILYQEGQDVDELARVTKLPIHPYIRCFDLADHTSEWYEVSSLKEYVYNPEIRRFLILPEDHSSLIDALVSDLDVVAEDIVEGKSGGTTILCKGNPGTGKTLTAEVYSESVRKPLYRVHSGQLGTDAESIEKVLKQSMERAERWKAILLIDEADVFLMRRTDDLERNAVVGVFLRTLEYFRGVLFLTTNRPDSIDDAIISRCIAVIDYKNPGYEERKSIWKKQAELAGAELPEKLIDDLAFKWDCSGRDIKGLIRLTSRYCRAHNLKPDMATFVRLATFRGM